MRQAGVIAAAGLYALEHNVERMAEDHANAKRLARAIAGAPGIAIDVEGVETNMVRFDVKGLGVTSQEFNQRLTEDAGVRVSTPGTTLVRAIPHLGITEAEVDEAGRAIVARAEALARKGARAEAAS
jgi:threonine aldolase